MTPEERQLLTGLFERIREQAATPRDPEAEQMISTAVGAQSYAPYLLAQAVIIQDHALRAANDRLQELEAQLRELESAQSQSSTSSGSFLGALGKSLFGDQTQRSPSQPTPSPWGSGAPQRPQSATPSYAPPPSYAPQSASPWGAPPYQQASPWTAASPPTQSGDFLKGALGAAAGVAGGVLLANSIRSLFSGAGNPYGMATGFAPGQTSVNDSGSDAEGASGGDAPNQMGGLQGSGYDDASDWSDTNDWPDNGDAGGGDDASDPGADDYNV